MTDPDFETLESILNATDQDLARFVADVARANDRCHALAAELKPQATGSAGGVAPSREEAAAFLDMVRAWAPSLAEDGTTLPVHREHASEEWQWIVSLCHGPDRYYDHPALRANPTEQILAPVEPLVRIARAVWRIVVLGEGRLHQCSASTPARPHHKRYSRALCGRWFVSGSTVGEVPVYCSATCRHRAWRDRTRIIKAKE